MKRLQAEVVRSGTIHFLSPALLQAGWLVAAHRPDEARVFFARAADLDSDGDAINAFGCFLRKQGELVESRRQFERLLSLAHARNDDELRVVAHHNLAAVYRELGDPHRARVHQQHSWRLTLECDFRGSRDFQLADGFAALAMDAVVAEDWTLAAQLARLALDCDSAEETGRESSIKIAEDWGALGIAAYGRGDIESAIPAFRRALRLHRRMHDTIGAGLDLLHLAKCLGARCRWNSAARFATLAARCFQKARHCRLEAEAHQFRKTAGSLDRIARFDPRRN